MGAELGTGYISIIPEVSKISPTIAKALGGVESEAERRGGSWGSKLAAGVGKTLKAGALATGVAVALSAPPWPKAWAASPLSKTPSRNSSA